MSIEELLSTSGIKPPSFSPGRYYVTCPRCSGQRSTVEHRKAKVLGVIIEPGGRVGWNCNHCDWKGPEPGALGSRPNGAGELVAHEYRDPNGVTRFRKVRNRPGREPKCWVEHPDGRGGWAKGAGGVNTKIFLYRIDEVAKAVAEGCVVCVAEGEKDADSLWRLGFPATCNASGAHDPTKRQKPKWYASHSAQLKDADIVVLGDNDLSGYEHADTTCRLSLGVAKRVRRLDLALHWPGIPKGGDVSDWLAQGHTREELAALIDGAPDYEGGEPPPPPPEPNPPKPEPEKHGLPNYSDEALALTFADRHHADLRFVPLWSKWLLWDGSRWKLDDRTIAFTRARIICREVAATYKGKRACDIASSKKVAAIGTLARGDSRHVATADQWDARLTRLSMPTRTMDLETGLGHPPDPLDYSTKVTAATAAPEGTDCPLWLEFLRKVTGDDEDADRLPAAVLGLLPDRPDDRALALVSVRNRRQRQKRLHLRRDHDLRRLRDHCADGDVYRHACRASSDRDRQAARRPAGRRP